MDFGPPNPAAPPTSSPLDRPTPDSLTATGTESSSNEHSIATAFCPLANERVDDGSVCVCGDWAVEGGIEGTGDHRRIITICNDPVDKLSGRAVRVPGGFLPPLCANPRGCSNCNLIACGSERFEKKGSESGGGETISGCYLVVVGLVSEGI